MLRPSFIEVNNAMLRHILSKRRPPLGSKTRLRAVEPWEANNMGPNSRGRLRIGRPSFQGFDGPRRFSTREGSEIETIKTLDRATFFVVNPRKNPLGTMDGASWEDVLAIMSGWLKRQEWKADMEPNSTTKLSGYSVDAAERLLQRLIHEKATTKPGSILRQERDLSIAEWQPAILNSWIHVGYQKQNDPSLLAAAAERAELALARIVDWYNQGGCWLPIPNNQDPLPVSSFVSLCHLWLQLDRTEGFVRAADLLITWTEGEDETSLLEAYKSDVAQCFNETTNHCTNLLQRQGEDEKEPQGDIGKMAVALVARIDLLRASGWDELEEISELARKMALMQNLQADAHTSAVDADASAADADKSRIFEETAMFQQMTELIRVADISDYNTIAEEVVPRLMESNDIPTEVARNISSALVDFFVRVKDAKQATHWMQRLDVIDGTLPDQEQPESRFNRLLSILELWAETEGSDDTVWRAEELLHRCESLEDEGGLHVRGELKERGVYLKMLRMWANRTKDADLNARKVHEMFAKHLGSSSQSDLEGLEIEDAKLVLAATSQKDNTKAVLEAMAATTQTNRKTAFLEPHELMALINLLEQKRNENPPEVMEEMLVHLIRSQKGKITSENLHRLRNLATIIESSSEEGPLKSSAMLCEAILQSSLPEMTSTEEKLELIQEMGGFDNSQATAWTLDCYNTAIAVLLRDEFRDGRSIDAAKELLEIVLGRLADENIPDASSESVASVITKALNQCMTSITNQKTEAQRKDATSLAEDILVIAENKFLTMTPENILGKTSQVSPISLPCFEKVLYCYFRTGQVNAFQKIFLRMYDYFRIGGYENLLPPPDIFAFYMECLSEKKANGKELEAVLDEWAGNCRDSDGDPMFLPSKTMCICILMAHQKDQNGAGAVQFAERQLKAAKSGQADVELASFLMDRAIQIASDCKAENLYDLVVTRLFRHFGMDESLNIKLPPSTWRDLLHACTKEPRNEFASKLSIMALTELRRAGRGDEWGYFRMMEIQRQRRGPGSVEVLRVVFQSCTEDGCLSGSLKRAFQREFLLFGPQVWNDVYTSKLLPPNGQEPVEWSANVSSDERKKARVAASGGMRSRSN